MVYNRKTKEETKVGYDYQIYPRYRILFVWAAFLPQGMLGCRARGMGTDAQDCL